MNEVRGRGRPTKYDSDPTFKKVVDKLEEDMQVQRARFNEKRSGTALMFWKCEKTGDTMYLEFPLRYTPTRALEIATFQDTDHTHHAWETVTIK